MMEHHGPSMEAGSAAVGMHGCWISIGRLRGFLGGLRREGVTAVGIVGRMVFFF